MGILEIGLILADHPAESTFDFFSVGIVIAAIGAINWGLIGLFGFDLVATITGAGKFGESNIISRIIYVVVGIAGILALFTLGGG